MPAKGGALHFCVEGNSLIGFALAQELQGFTVGDRSVDVRWAKKEQDLRDCHAIFIGGSDEKSAAKVLESTKGGNVLTFGETDGFLEAGGTVRLSTEGNQVQFQINLAAARSAGLKIDARLLGLAKRVVNGRELPGG